MSTTEHNFEPMTTGMVLDRSFRLYVDNFVLMVGLSAILNVPILFLSFLFTAGRIDPLHLNAASVIAIVVGVILFLVAAIIVAPMIAGATALAVSDIYLGKIASAGAVLSAAWRRLWTLLKTQIVVGLILAGLMLLAAIVLGIVGGIFSFISPVIAIVGMILGFLAIMVLVIQLFLSYALIAPIVMIEHSDSGREIRNRSWRLVEGQRWKVFLVFLVLVLIQLLISGGILGVELSAAAGLGTGSASIISAVLNGIASILLTPLSAISVTLLYYDFRIRKEGFDLEMLSQSISGTATDA